MGKTIEQKYIKKSQKEHILDRPDSYIGDISPQNDILWVYNSTLEKMEKRNINYVPGLIKIFDEILVNAGDNTKEDKLCNTIRVTIDKETNEISVWNNGKGIDIVMHKEHNMLVPTLIFGELLTSTNYDDTEKRITGGRNGYGAKLTNIYSSYFEVEIVDKKRKKKFNQIFENNMSKKSDPIVTSLKSPSEGYTKITFKPDLKRFSLNELTDDIISLMIKRVYDIAATTSKKISVYYNNIKILVNNFKKYISLFFDESKIIYEEVNDRWQIGILYLPDNGYDQISYVNCISTFKGGNHVKYIENNIIKKIEEQIKKKNKNIKIKNSQIKENLVFFINTIIENPSFTSQTKEELKTRISLFGSKCDLSEKTIKKILETGISEQVLLYAKLKEESIMKKKTDGKKVSNLKGIPKLEDANWAGTKRSSECKLILTEGDSAKAFAMAGRAIVGNNKYGVFPLKGKLLNVRTASVKQLLENAEIKHIKKIIGLQQGKKYNDVSSLRYGGIILLTDQDNDGFHIKGLLINFIHYFWPSLVKLNSFIFALATPIIKISKKSETISFYNISDYEQWKKKPNGKNWNIKYYKGLGTSSSKEAKEYFLNLEDKLIKYTCKNLNKVIKDEQLVIKDEIKDEKEEINDEKEEINDEKLKISESSKKESSKKKSSKKKSSKKNNFDATLDIDSEEDDTTNSIRLAFEKTRANDRKKWLLNYDKDIVLDNEEKIVPIVDFIHKELIHFSNDDLNRSIPSINDGLKPSTRKILYSSFLRKLYSKKNELRVAQLAGYVSDKTCYHHGEKSLADAIVNMAQNYIGSNNINILYPSGQFGTRLLGGDDKASPRYIHTYLGELTKYIYREEDNPILNYLNDDGVLIEPASYYPIIPMVLVNGAEGIGTGFSTSIPKYNPRDIIENIFNLMNKTQLKKLKPWYFNFKGKVIKSDKNTYSIYGNYKILDGNTILINELPIGMWTTNYKEYLEKIQYDNDSKSNVIIDFTDNNTDEKIHFVVTFPDNKLDLFVRNDTIEGKLKLIKKIKISNMHLFNDNNAIQKFDDVNDILSQWYDTRLDKYKLRKEYLISKINSELDLLKYKSLFIKYVIEEKIIVFKRRKNDVIKDIEKFKFPKLSENKSFDYITNMQLFSLTKEKIQELENRIKNKEKELKKVIKKSEINMWKEELNEFIKKYDIWHDKRVSEFEKNIIHTEEIKKSKKKTVVKRKKKNKKKI